MKLVGPIPNSCYLAFSGGGDSCAALSFLLNGRKNVDLLYVHHGTEHADDALKYVHRVSEILGCYLHVHRIEDFRKKSNSESKEEYWRNARYNWFKLFNNKPIVTAHHLDDCIETWIFGAMHGQPKLIPYSRSNGDGEPIIRPFLAATRKELMAMLMANGPDILREWVEDPSNEDVKYMRNLIRHEMRPIAERVNPGIEKVIRKKVMAEFQERKA